MKKNKRGKIKKTKPDIGQGLAAPSIEKSKRDIEELKPISVLLFCFHEISKHKDSKKFLDGGNATAPKKFIQKIFKLSEVAENPCYDFVSANFFKADYKKLKGNGIEGYSYKYKLNNQYSVILIPEKRINKEENRHETILFLARARDYHKPKKAK